MRICFVSTAKQWGGGEQLLASLLEGIIKAGHEVGLAARRGCPMAQWGLQRHLPLLLELPGRGRSPKSLFQLRRWLSKNRFDVLVLNDPHAITSGGVAAYRTNILKVGIRHTTFPIHSAWKHNRLLDHLVCVAKVAQQQCHESGIDPSKTSVIYAGLKNRPINHESANRLRQQLELAADDPAEQHLLTLGSLLPVKGFDTVIRAVAKGLEKGNSWRLWLAGDGPEKETLQTLANELGIADRVHFLGFRQDIGELLDAADVLVSASHLEGLSLVLIEAMMAGCPLIATPVGGNCEALQIDLQGNSYWAETFQPDDVEKLIAALEKTLRDKTATQRQTLQAKEFAETTFSVHQMTENHLSLYQQLLSD